MFSDPPSRQLQNDNDLSWATKEPRDVGPCAYRAARWVARQQLGRETDLAKAEILYGGIRQDDQFVGSNLANYLETTWYEPSVEPKLSLNVIRAVIDTAVARITNVEVRPQFLTTGGDYFEQQKAKELEKFSDGQAYAARLRKLGPMIFRDALIDDIGAAHVFANGEEVETERVLPYELFCDISDGRYSKPYQLYRRKWIPREVLLDLYADAGEGMPGTSEERRQAIESAHAGSFEGTDTPANHANRLVDHLLVIECWRRRARKNGKGRHCIAIEALTLFEEEWNKDDFPVPVVRYSDATRGWYGVGMGHHLKGNQRQINHLLKTIMNVSQHTVPGVWVEEGSHVDRNMLTNDIMAARTYRGNPPIISPGARVDPSLWEQLDRLYRQSFDQEGVSQMDAKGDKPPGLDAGVAIREYRDVGTERFSVATKNYEEFRLEIAERQVDTAREIEERYKGKVFVLVPNRTMAEKFYFKDVNLKRETYILQLHPTNALPRSPEARLQSLQELIQAGMIDATTFKRLMGFPDLDAEMSLELAPFELVLEALARIERGDDFEGPDPKMPLDFASKVAQGSWCRAKRLKAPDYVLENLSLFGQQANAYLKQFGAQAPAPGAASAGGPPTGAPGAAPTAALLPTAPQAAA